MGRRPKTGNCDNIMQGITAKQAEDWRRQLEREICAENCRYFIERYVQIEDRDSPTLASPFALWPGQVDALRAFEAHRLNIALKSRQLGMSWLALSYATWLIWRRPGVSVIVMSRGEDESKEMARRVEFVMRHLPEWLTPTWDATTSTVTINHDGECSTLQSMPAGRNSGRSFTANLIILDEWAFQVWAREIWASIFPSVNRPSGGQVIGISTIERGTLFEDIWTSDDTGFNRIFLPWSTDPRRTPEWYERTRKALGDACLAEYPATPEEALSTPGGSFFPEVRGHIHLVDPISIPDWWTRVIALDYGMDMLAAYWIAIDGQGHARVYREVYQSGLTISEAAEAIKRASGNEHIAVRYAPPDLYNNRQDTGRSAAEIFAQHGVPLYKASNSRVSGWMSTHEWLLPRECRDEQTGDVTLQPDIVIEDGHAPNLWRCLVSIQKDKHDPNDAADKPHELTHAPDALRYFCASRTSPSVKPTTEQPDKKSTYDTARKALTKWR